MPDVSVLMSVFNTPRSYLSSSIESILNQTLSSFEFLIIDDGSDQETKALLKEYAQKDTRIHLITNETNIGLTKSLNLGLKHVRGRYMARMDADDIALPDRLEKQVLFMDRHDDIDVAGSAIQAFPKKKDIFYETVPSALRFNFINNYSPLLAHPSVIVRSSLIAKGDYLYREDIRYAQDYALWNDLLTKGYRLSNMDDILLLYRVHADSISSVKLQEQNALRLTVRTARYEDLLNRALSEKEKSFISENRVGSDDLRYFQSFIKEVLQKIEAPYKPRAQYYFSLLVLEKIKTQVRKTVKEKKFSLVKDLVVHLYLMTASLGWCFKSLKDPDISVSSD